MSSWFVALPIDATDWLERIADPPPGTRGVTAPDLHLTVAFFGAVAGEVAREAFAARSVASLGAMRVRLGRVAPYGPRQRPSAFGVEVGDADPAGPSLATRLAPLRDALLDAAGLPPEARAMRPHVTLARPARKARRDERRQALAWAEACGDLGITITLDRVALYTAAQRGTARAYEIVESRALDAATPP